MPTWFGNTGGWGKPFLNRPGCRAKAPLGRRIEEAGEVTRRGIGPAGLYHCDRVIAEQVAKRPVEELAILTSVRKNIARHFSVWPREQAAARDTRHQLDSRRGVGLGHEFRSSRSCGYAITVSCRSRRAGRGHL